MVRKVNSIFFEIDMFGSYDGSFSSSETMKVVIMTLFWVSYSPRPARPLMEIVMCFVCACIHG